VSVTLNLNHIITVCIVDMCNVMLRLKVYQCDKIPVHIWCINKIRALLRRVYCLVVANNEENCFSSSSFITKSYHVVSYVFLECPKQNVV